MSFALNNWALLIDHSKAMVLMLFILCVAFGCSLQGFITKTCLYNFDPLKAHFYIAKLGFIGVYIIFFISAQNIDYGYSLELPR